MDSVFRRLQLMLGLGKVYTTVDSGNAQVAQVGLSAAETRDNTPMMGLFGVISNPPVGSDVVYVAMSGDRSKVLVVGTNHQQSRYRNAPVGAGGVYDQKGSFLIFTNDGNATLSLSGTLTVEAPTTHFTGDVLTDGSIAATGSISSAVDVIGGPTDISLVNHLTSKVQVGNGVSGPPVPGT